MKSHFIETIIRTANANKNKTAIVDSDGKYSMTYEHLLRFATRTAAYIKSKDIGPGNFIGVRMIKSAEYMATELGIWLAGCAAVPMSDSYPQDRVDYIVSHCEAPLVIDIDCLGDIANCNDGEILVPDASDNALIIYTSGSTGNPKGVLHSFETLDNMIQQPLFPGIGSEDVVYASGAPFTFALAIRSWSIIASGNTFHILSDDVAKSTEILEKYIEENNITVCNISPAVLKIFRNRSDSLKMVFSGGEKFTTQYSKDGYELWSDYGQSETIAAIANYLLPDHPLEKVPVGKCNSRYEYRIVDENDNNVSDGETGELLLKGPIFKEYYKAPEINAEAFRDGWYHTKDLVYKNIEGELQFVNRKDWMIKINGQRVEPGEIEGALRNVQGIRDAVVKDFTREDGSVYICAYYIPSEPVTKSYVKQEIEKKLTHYMIPSYFVEMDDFPKLPNGKLNRKELAEPNVADFQNDYVAPETEVQKNICDAMGQILHMDKIGLNDSFFELGGNSILCMEMCSLLKDEYDIRCSVKVVYGNETPEKIAEALEKDNAKSIDSRNSISRDQYPLPFQVFYIDYQLLDADNRMANIVSFLKMKRSLVDPYELKAAVDEMVRRYSAFGSVFTFNDDCEVVVRYRPDLIKEVSVTETTEDEIEDKYKPEFTKYFAPFNTLLYRFAVFATENSTYLFSDFHHSICDGTFSKNLQKTIFDIMNGKETPKDYYYEYLEIMREENEEAEPSDDYKNGYETYPTPDMDLPGTTRSSTLITSEHTYEEFLKAAEKKNITFNNGLVAGTLLGLHRYNEADRVGVEWIYNGRDEEWKNDLMGLTMQSIKANADFADIGNVNDLLEKVNREMNVGLKKAQHAETDYTFSPGRSEYMKVIYEKNIGLPDNVPEGTEISIDFDSLEGHPGMAHVIIDEPQLDEPVRIIMLCNGCRYSMESIERMGNMMMMAFEECIFG